MNWLCPLYGHTWRHPGAYEVIVAEGAVPTHRLECDRCGTVKFVEAGRPPNQPDPGPGKEPRDG